MGLTIFHIIFPDISQCQGECEKYQGIFCGTMSVPQNIVMDLNIVVVKLELELKLCLIKSFVIKERTW